MTRNDPFANHPPVPSFTVTSTTLNEGDTLALDQMSGMFGVPGGLTAAPACHPAPSSTRTTRAAPASSAPRRLPGRPTATSSTSTRSTPATSVCRPTRRQALLGFNLFGHTIARAQMIVMAGGG